MKALNWSAFFVWIILLTWVNGACLADQSQIASCIEATVRLRTSGGTGTGCVFEHDQQKDSYFILTNAHVAERVGTRVTVEFWSAGYQSPEFTGENVASWMSENPKRDIAVVSVPWNKSLPDSLRPKIIPFAPRNYEVKTGQSVCSVGCARGAWPTAWKGHVANARGTELGTFFFQPTPAGGRSGSAVFNEDGTMIVGLIAWSTVDEYGLSVGKAQHASTVYKAFDNERDSMWVADNRAGWEDLDQCPPGQPCPQNPQQPPGSGFNPWNNGGNPPQTTPLRPVPEFSDRSAELQEIIEALKQISQRIDEQNKQCESFTIEINTIKQELVEARAEIVAVAAQTPAEGPPGPSGKTPEIDYDMIVSNVVQQIGSHIDQRFTVIQNSITNAAEPYRRLLYFTSDGHDACVETDQVARQLRDEGYPITFIYLEPQEITVGNVPRTYMLPEQNEVGGTADVLAYLHSLQKQ